MTEPAVAEEASTPSSTRFDSETIPALLEWIGENGPHRMGTSLASTPVSLDIDFDAAERTASFKIRTLLHRRHARNRPATPIYMIIAPTQIQSIARSRLEPEPDSSTRPQEDAREAATYLHFQLDAAPTLILPPDPLRPADRSLFHLVGVAARQVTLSVVIPEGTLSEQQLNELCQTSFQDFHSSSRHEIGRLYAGRGGRVTNAAEIEQRTQENPPSYDEAGPPPPASFTSDGSSGPSSSKKRQRTSSPDRSLDLSDVELICKKIALAQQAALQSMLSKELSSMEVRILDCIDGKIRHLDDKWQAEATKREEQFQQFQARLDEAHEAGESLNMQFESLEEQLQEMNEHIDGRVDFEVEDRVLGIKMDLEDYVKDELANTEQTLKDRLLSASLSLNFSDS